jgi:hypothetical protein
MHPFKDLYAYISIYCRVIYPALPNFYPPACSLNTSTVSMFF